jgi:hypothetical protein
VLAGPKLLEQFRHLCLQVQKCRKSAGTVPVPLLPKVSTSPKVSKLFQHLCLQLQHFRTVPAFCGWTLHFHFQNEGIMRESFVFLSRYTWATVVQNQDIVLVKQLQVDMPIATPKSVV